MISNVKSARMNLLSNGTTNDDEPEISINASKPLLPVVGNNNKISIQEPSEFKLNATFDPLANEDLWLWSYEEQAEQACIEHDNEGK